MWVLSASLDMMCPSPLGHRPKNRRGQEREPGSRALWASGRLCGCHVLPSPLAHLRAVSTVERTQGKTG